MHSCRSVVHTIQSARSVHTLAICLTPLPHISNGGCWEIDAPGARGAAASPAASPHADWISYCCYCCCTVGIAHVILLSDIHRQLD